MKHLILLTPFILSLAACGPAPQAGKEASVAASMSASAPALASRLSQYTPLTGCRVIKSNPDEAGYRVSECPGIGGFGVQLVESDGRANLMLTPPQGQPQSLRLSEQGGGGFSELGDQIEWRGKSGAEPDAVIVRYKVVEKADEPMRWTSYLLVVALTEKPCVAAKIAPGPEQNEKARAAADDPMICI